MTHYKDGEPYSAKRLPPQDPKGDFEPTLTRQSEAKQTDINYIMAKYQETGYLPPLNKAVFFADVADVGTFDNALALVHGIEETFLELPPEVRKKFNNDPAQFIDFTNQPENIQEMRDMGLLKPDEVAPAQPEINAAIQRIVAAIDNKVEEPVTPEPVPQQD